MPAFIDDISADEALQGAVVRASCHRGRIRALGLPALPEGYHAVTAAEIPGDPILSCFGCSAPVLAATEVAYRGQPLALLCGPDQEVLAELAGSVSVEAEDEPPILEAAEGSQAIVYSRGDAAAGFAGAFQIVEAEYRTAAQRHYHTDPQGALARWDGSSLVLHASTQDPFCLRREIARLLDVPERKVRVIASRLGCTLEGKLLSSILVAAQAALIQHRTALDREGNPIGARVRILLDGGAYPPAGSAALTQAARAAWGDYLCPHLEVRAAWAVTNNAPAGSFRADGRAQAFFAAELQASRLEKFAQLDPYAWKMNNLTAAGSAARAGGKGAAEGARRAGPAPAQGAMAVLDEVARLSDFRPKHAACAALRKRRKGLLDTAGPLRGIGLSLCSQGLDPEENGFAENRPSAVRVVFSEDQRARIFSSFVDTEQGIYRLFTEQAARILDLDPSRVQVEPVDTLKVPDTGPSTLGRALTVGSQLLEQCCRAVQRRRGKGSLPIAVTKSRQPSAGRLKRRADPIAERSWGGCGTNPC